MLWWRFAVIGFTLLLTAPAALAGGPKRLLLLGQGPDGLFVHSPGLVDLLHRAQRPAELVVDAGQLDARRVLLRATGRP